MVLSDRMVHFFWRWRKILTNLPKLSCGFNTEITQNVELLDWILAKFDQWWPFLIFCGDPLTNSLPSSPRHPSHSHSLLVACLQNMLSILFSSIHELGHRGANFFFFPFLEGLHCHSPVQRSFLNLWVISSSGKYSGFTDYFETKVRYIIHHWNLCVI